MVPEQHKLWGDNILGSARTLGNTGGTSALPALMTLSIRQKFPFCMDSILSLNKSSYIYSISSSKFPEDLFRRQNSMLSVLLSSDSKCTNESDLINILGATQWRARPSDQRTENKIPGWKALWCRNRVFTTIYTRRGIWRGRRCWPLVSPDLFHKPLRSSSK